jgi:hypothetical protein
MEMVKSEAIVARLNKLNTYLAVLESKKSISLDEYCSSIELQAVVERFFELSIVVPESVVRY